MYFSDKCAQCLKPACAPQLAACKDASCSSALACVQTSKATSFNCQVDGCVAAIAAAPTANDVLLCLADKCATDCGATPGFPCQPVGAGTGTFLGASCGSCVDTSCASLANSCVADGACKTALSCVKSGLGAGKTMNCAVDGCINEIASSPKSSDLLVCMADKCGSTCKATTGFKCP